MSRQYIRIYSSWFAETASLNDAEKGRLIDSLIRFVIMDKEEPPPGNERIIYPIMIDRIRRERDTHERHKAEREAKRNDRKRI